MSMTTYLMALVRTTRRLGLVLIHKIKRTCYLVDSAVSAEHKVKESEKMDTYLDPTPELKKPSKMKVTDNNCC